jgi:hypothetical protein
MHDEVAYRKHLNEYRGKGGQWKDYPSVSVGAEYNGKLAIGHHHCVSQSQDFHPLVLRELTTRLGKLNGYGTNYPACTNLVGHCAENYAASGALNSFDPNGNINNARLLSSIQFTKAFRPRTWKNVGWCENCHTMFD